MLGPRAWTKALRRARCIAQVGVPACEAGRIVTAVGAGDKKGAAEETIPDPESKNYFTQHNDILSSTIKHKYRKSYYNLERDYRRSHLNTTSPNKHYQ
jgi:hypothetical protein